MKSVICTSLCASLAMSCGPEAPAEPDTPGALEYEDSYTRLHRLGRRVDAVYVLHMGDVEHHECGMLSERAYTELEDTLSALDPEESYEYDPDGEACPPGARIHVEGFTHSPFACDFMCCPRELARAALIYWLVSSYFGGSKDPITIDGEPYLAIEPDAPCP